MSFNVFSAYFPNGSTQNGWIEVGGDKLRSALTKILAPPDDSTVADRINKIRVINLSIWMAAMDGDFLDMLAKLEDKGIVVCASAGNKFLSSYPSNEDGANINFYVTLPARLPNIVSVGAVNRLMGRAQFSRFTLPTITATSYVLRGYQGSMPRSAVDLVAPGRSIWSATPEGRKFYSSAEDGATKMDGTSMASPLVAAAAACLFHRFETPNSRPTAAQIRAALALCVDTGVTTSSQIATKYIYGSGSLNWSLVESLASLP